MLGAKSIRLPTLMTARKECLEKLVDLVSRGQVAYRHILMLVRAWVAMIAKLRARQIPLAAEAILMLELVAVVWAAAVSVMATSLMLAKTRAALA